ncbi:MAG: lipid-A-disaccharide synthase [Hyphomicrobiaceae bacterium]
MADRVDDDDAADVSAGDRFRGAARLLDASENSSRELRLFLVAGEHSGDALGAQLMAAINSGRRGRVRYLGVGGPLMETEGLVSQFPLSDVAVMGPLAILRRLPRLVRRVHQTANAAVAAEPDAVIIIDSPEFTHPIAKRIRRKRADLPIIDYVSPSVWAWRPGRAGAMRAYIDHVLALLPFEPATHARLGGPPCTYVGHPLIERHEAWQAIDPKALAARLGLSRTRPVVVVLPGSRRSEIERLMAPFGAAIERLLAAGRLPQVIIPTLPHVRPLLEAQLKSWPLQPHIVESEADKIAAFKLATVALAASGTVTLELGLTGTPMVVAYRVDRVAAQLQFLVKTPHFALANLVLDERAFPELMQDDCTPEKLADALLRLIDDHEGARAQQLAALARIPKIMRLAGGTPSEAAAGIVLEHALRPKARNRDKAGAK